MIRPSTSTPRRPGTASTLLVLWALLAAAAPARPQAPSAPAETRPAQEADLEALRQLVAALNEADGPGIAALVDFERRAAERLARGQATRPWEDLDELDRHLEQRATVEAWLAEAGHFVRAMTLVGANAVADPDAGLGPVPDRHLVRADLRRLVGGEHRDLLVTLTPEARVLDLRFGAPYHPGSGAAGEAGLQPEAVLSVPGDLAVAWPAEIDDFERGKLGELVDRLLGLPQGTERDLVVEQLHRSPRQAVAALLERLVALEAEGFPVEGQARLDAALSHITGRPSGFRTAPRPGRDLVDLRAHNHAVVQSWLRWQHEHGTRFVATAIVPPLDPTVAEKAGRAPQAEATEWDAGLDARSRSAAGGDGLGTDAGPEPAPDPPHPGVDPPAETSSGPEAPPEPTPEDRPGLDAPGTRALPDGPAHAPRPSVDLGTPGDRPPQRSLLFPAAADLELRFDGARRPAREIEALLTPALLAALNEWAQPVHELDLQVLVADPPSRNLLLLARAPADVARDALATLERAHALLDGLLPAPSPDEADAVVAVLLDREGVERAWRPLLERLVTRRLLLGGQAEHLAGDPRGVLLRKVPLFLQPSWDIAGEGEFALVNELAHKAAQCMVTQRAGELPPNLLWGLGQFVEQRLFDSVYQFNTTGFVATADHFDWPQRARQHIENRSRKAGFAFSRLALDDASAGTAELPQMVTWALLAFLADDDPGGLRGTLEALGALHADKDRSGRATSYRGDPERTRALLAERFDSVDPKRVMGWLRGLR